MIPSLPLLSALPLLLLLHEDNRLDATYFWSAVLIAALPIAAFVVFGVKVTRAYFARREPDGGGDPPARATPPR